MTQFYQRGRYGKYIPVIFTGMDFLLLNVALTVAIFNTIDQGEAVTLYLLANMAYFPIAYHTLRLHSLRPIKMENLIADAFKSVLAQGLTFLAALYIFRVNDIPCTFFAYFYGIFLIASPIGRSMSRLALKHIRKRGRNYSRVVIVGCNNTTARLIRQLSSDAGFGYKVLGVFDDEKSIDIPDNLYRGPLDMLDDYVKRYAIDEVFCTLSGNQGEAINRTLAICDSNVAQYYYVPQLTRYISRQFDTYTLGTMQIMSVRNNPLKKPVNQIAKRSFDIAVSGCLLILSPVILIPMSIAIKMSSPGPVFFKQKRTGYKGREFICWKFRSMKVNNDADVRQASFGDPRTTKLGRFIRHTSIDELPQIFNVLKGDMSLVGPRPHMLSQTDAYRHIVDKYMVRHFIKPGITGWAQINGFRGPTEKLWKMEKRVEHDVWYIENWSFLLDLKILARTIANILSGEKNAV